MRYHRERFLDHLFKRYQENLFVRWDRFLQMIEKGRNKIAEYIFELKQENDYSICP